MFEYKKNGEEGERRGGRVLSFSFQISQLMKSLDSHTYEGIHSSKSLSPISLRSLFSIQMEENAFFRFPSHPFPSCLIIQTSVIFRFLSQPTLSLQSVTPTPHLVSRGARREKPFLQGTRRWRVLFVPEAHNFIRKHQKSNLKHIEY